jgi:pimeloyl-ACP methyl ester carboxylesterase
MITKFLYFPLLLSWTVLLCVSCAHQAHLQARQGTDKFAIVRGKNIHYVEIGSGTPVILIPGLFSTYRTWDRMVPFLETKHHLLAIDNFGTGDSGIPVEGFNYSVNEQADMIIAMMDELNISCCDLIGVSYGGMIALNIAARYPDRVATVVCIEGGVIMPKNSPYKMLEQGLNTPIIGDTIISLIQSGLFNEAITKDIMGSSWAEMKAEEQSELIDIISGNIKAASRLTWLALARALNNASDFTEEAKSITAPILYLSGEKSSFREMTDANIAFFKDNLPNARLVSFEDGVHDLELQKPGETAALVQEFIEQNAIQCKTTISTSLDIKQAALHLTY